MAKKKILIVDDENFFIEPIKRYLEMNGFDIITANDGMSGLQVARTSKPDIIILDLMLPKVNGYQLCHLLKFDEKFKKIPVIILSAKDTEKDKSLGKQSGADLYLTKPINPKFLLGNINQLLV